jgi:protein involved in polysaccharide export with SLBB domain
VSSIPLESEKRFLEIVTVSGSVRYIGPYARTASLKLSSIITPDQLLEETSLEYAEITRLKADGTPEYLTFAPIDVLEGRFDLDLRARDTISLAKKTVFGGTLSPANMEKFSNVVQLTGQAARPETFAYRNGLKLSNVLTKDQLLLDTNLNYAEITRLKADGKNEYITFRPADILAGTWNFDLGPRDVIRLVKVGYSLEIPDFDRFDTAILLKGPVQFSGLYAWKEGLDLASIQKTAKPILDTNQVYAEIIRPLPGGKQQTITFAPREVDSALFNTDIQPRDTVRYFSLSEAASKAKAAMLEQGEAGESAATADSTATTAVAVATVSQNAAGEGASAAAASGSAISTDLGLFLEVVYVSGAVRYSGPYARTPTLKLSSVVTTDQILQNTNLDYAEMTRRKPNGDWEYTTFSPREVFQGSYDIDLRAQDSIRFVDVGYLPANPDFDRFGNAYALVGAARVKGLFSMQQAKPLSEIVVAEQLLGATDLYYGEIERWIPGGRTEYITFSPYAIIAGLNDIRIFPRDIVRLVPAGMPDSSFNLSRYPNVVILKGKIKNLGRYAWYEGLNLSTLIQSDDLLIETDSGYAEIKRKSMESESVLSFSPSAIVRGESDIQLESRDVVIFYPKFNQAPVTVSGEVREPKVVPYYKDMELAALLRSVTFLGHFESLKASIVNSEGIAREVYLEAYFRRQSVDKIILSPGDAVSIKRLLPDERLPIVTVRGSVKNPQSIEFKEGMRLAEALEATGGYESSAYPKGLVLIRKTAADMQQKQVDRLIAQLEAASAAGAALPIGTDTSLSSAAAIVANMQIDLAIQRAKLGQLKQLYKEGFGRISLDMPKTLGDLASSSANVVLERDDLIFVPLTPTYVLVSGEVSDQSIVAYRDGITVREAIAESGWLSREADLPNAYIIRASGKLESTNKKGFLWFRPNILKYRLNPGDTVYIPTKSVRVNVAWSYAKDSFSLLASILTAALTTKTLLGL